MSKANKSSTSPPKNQPSSSVPQVNFILFRLILPHLRTLQLLQKMFLRLPRTPLPNLPRMPQLHLLPPKVNLTPRLTLKMVWVKKKSTPLRMPSIFSILIKEDRLTSKVPTYLSRVKSCYDLTGLLVKEWSYLPNGCWFGFWRKWHHRFRIMVQLDDKKSQWQRF